MGLQNFRSAGRPSRSEAKRHKFPRACCSRAAKRSAIGGRAALQGRVKMAYRTSDLPEGYRAAKRRDINFLAPAARAQRSAIGGRAALQGRVKHQRRASTSRRRPSRSAKREATRKLPTPRSAPSRRRRCRRFPRDHGDSSSPRQGTTGSSPPFQRREQNGKNLPPSAAGPRAAQRSDERKNQRVTLFIRPFD
jgi:hypothetical protein